MEGFFSGYALNPHLACWKKVDYLNSLRKREESEDVTLETDNYTKAGFFNIIDCSINERQFPALSRSPFNHSNRRSCCVWREPGAGGQGGTQRGSIRGLWRYCVTMQSCPIFKVYFQCTVGMYLIIISVERFGSDCARIFGGHQIPIWHQ